MANTTWTGLRGNYRTASLWSAGAPTDGSTGYVPSGTIVAADQTLSGASLVLDGYAPETGRPGSAAGATLALTGSVIAADESVLVDAGAFAASGRIAVAGPDVNRGLIAVTQRGSAPASLTITVSDLVSRSGAVLSSGSLYNRGTIADFGGTLVIRGVTTDTALVNNGTVTDSGYVLADIALRGTGAINLVASASLATPVLEVARSVGAGQTIDLGGAGVLKVDAPLSFQGKVTGLAGGLIQLVGFHASSETYDDGTLTLTGAGGSVSFALPGFAGLDGLAITDTEAGTTIGAGAAAQAIPPAPDGVAPVAAPAPNARTPVFANGYLVRGSVTNYEKTVHGTTLVGGSAGNSVPTVELSQAVLAADGVIASNAAPASGTATPYATVNVTGGARNDGQILANSKQGLFRLTIDDLRAPGGTVLTPGQLQNRGLIAATGDRLIITGGAMDASLINSGTITAAGGATIELNAVTLGLGTINVLGGSTLSVRAAVGAEQTVNLDPEGAATLAIANLRSFAAGITGFGAGDTIRLTGGDYDVAGYSGGVLSLSGAAGAASLSIAGAGAAADFVVEHAGGSTLITHA